MTRDRARGKYHALCRMTIDRGCTPHEAATAARLAAALAQRFGFTREPSETTWRPDFEARWTRAEARAVVRFSWEYRRCGKPRCHCAGVGGTKHGPYRYGKKREGRKVRSIYVGR